MDERSIEVVLDVFIIVIGVAIERFITKFPLGNDPAFDVGPPRHRGEERDHRKVHNPWYWPCYVLSLIVIVTLALRFLIGSDFHLRQAYIHEWINSSEFIVDICFLLLFGGFIVTAALAEDIRGFAKWLALCSGITVVWGLVAFRRANQHGLILWWLEYDSIQFVITLFVAYCCRHYQRRKKHKACLWVFLILVGWYAAFFPFDINKILKSRPSDRGTCIQGSDKCPQ